MTAPKRHPSSSGPDGAARRFRHRGVLAALLVMATPLAYLLVFGGSFLPRHLETDPTKLLPAARQSDPILRAQIVTAEKMSRSALVLFPGAEESGAANRKSVFLEKAERSGLFADAIDLGDDRWLRNTLAELEEFRLPLLFPVWLEKRRSDWDGAAGSGSDFAGFAAREAAGALDAWLARADAFAWDEWLPHDPLLLLPDALETTSLAADAPDAAAGGITPVWLWLNGDPFDAEYREKLETFFAASGEAIESQTTGAFLFAAESERRVRRELGFLAGFTTLALLLVVFFCLRRPAKLAAVFLNLLVSFSGALVLTALVFDRIHLISFLFALLFGGLAVDYTLHVLLKKESLGLPTYGSTLRAIARPFLGIGLTTISGFLVLVWLGVPVLRQAGFLVASGIAFSLAFNALYFTAIDPYRKSEPPGATSRHLNGRFPPKAARPIAGALAVLVPLGLLTLLRVDFVDDIADLRPPLPDLMERDERIREASGAHGVDHAYLAAGGDWDRTVRALRALSPDSPGAADDSVNTAHLGNLLPTETEFRRARVFHRENPDWANRLADELERTGFEAGAFEPFWRDFAGYRQRNEELNTEDVLDELHDALRGPARFLLGRAGDSRFLGVLSDRPLTPDERAGGLYPLDYGGSLSSVLNQYRAAAAGAFPFAVLFLAILPAVFLGIRKGAAVTVLTAGSVLGAIAIVLFVAERGTLFHLAGFMVGACLSMDYAFFATAHRPHEPPASIRLAAYSTFCVAAILSTASIPAVAATSAAVAATVGLGYLSAESYIALVRTNETGSGATARADDE